MPEPPVLHAEEAGKPVPPVRAEPEIEPEPEPQIKIEIEEDAFPPAETPVEVPAAPFAGGDPYAGGTKPEAPAADAPKTKPAAGPSWGPPPYADVGPSGPTIPGGPVGPAGPTIPGGPAGPAGPTIPGGPSGGLSGTDGAFRGKTAAAGNGASPMLLVVPALVIAVLAVVALIVVLLKTQKPEQDRDIPVPGGLVQSDIVPQTESGTDTGTDMYVPDTTDTEPDTAEPDTVEPDTTEPAGPVVVPVAEPTESTVVLRNAHPNARLLVDGAVTPFEYVGNDIVVQRSDLKDVCQVRIIADSNGSYETAAVWFNYKYGNELSFADDYGPYVPCDESGEGEPSRKVVNILVWAYHESFLKCINEQSAQYLRYSTDKNTVAETEHIFSKANAQNTYDLDNFSAVCDPDSITYYGDGRAVFNAQFTSYATNRKTGSKSEVISRKTMEIVWEDGVWKVNRLAFVSDGDYEARRYAELP